MPSGDAIPLMGTTLLQEYEDVLLHPGVFRRSRLNEHEREALLDIFLARCERERFYRERSGTSTFLERPAPPR